VPDADRINVGAVGPSRVQRADRIRDWLALGLVLAGALLYGTAQSGMGTLARDQTPTTAEQSARGEWKMVRWNRFYNMSRAGVALVVAGGAVAVFSFAIHAWRRKGSSDAS
jgi:hypothetical protein